MDIFKEVAEAMQTVLSTKALIIAKESNFIKRERKLTIRRFVVGVLRLRKFAKRCLTLAAYLRKIPGAENIADQIERSGPSIFLLILQNFRPVRKSYPTPVTKRYLTIHRV